METLETLIGITFFSLSFRLDDFWSLFGTTESDKPGDELRRESDSTGSCFT